MKLKRSIILIGIAITGLFLYGCLHTLIDTEEDGDEKIYMYATPTTTGSINGGSRAGVDSYCVDNKPSSMNCNGNGGIHAFISVDASDLAYNLDIKYSNLPTDRPIYNSDESQKIADNWSDFTDGSIHVSMQDALGTSTDHWTGGITGSSSDTCNASQGWDDTTYYGYSGLRTGTDISWFEYSSLPCSSSFHVLCLCWDD